MYRKFYLSPNFNADMNLARYCRQLFPLIPGNSRTHFFMASTQSLSSSSFLSKEENEINLDENPYFQKYSEKIKKLKETNPTEYYKRLDAIKKAAKQPDNAQMFEAEMGKKSQTSKEEKPVENKKGLDAVMKVDLLRSKSGDEISQIWKDHYKDRNSVYAVIPAETYRLMNALTRVSPLFIYPIPRKDGHEIFVGQFLGNDCHFTTLALYQKHGEYAPVQLVIHHYTEFQEDKGIVLMCGNVPDKGINVTDAQLLTYQIQYFYSNDNYHLIRDFNLQPQTFDYNKVIDCVSKTLLSKQSQTMKPKT